jgi:hypothetical protein
MDSSGLRSTARTTRCSTAVAFLNRQAVDYGSELMLSREDIDTLVAHADDFLAGVRQFLAAHARQGT